MERAPEPHDLLQIKFFVRFGASRRLTNRARYDVMALGYEVDDVVDCICDLTEADFHKSEDSRDFPGRRLDVYLPDYLGKKIYVKLDLYDDYVLVVSFHREGNPG